MNIEAKFGPGDRVWVTGSDGQPRLLTVGQVRVTVTDTPGLDLGDGIDWDNFAPRNEKAEEYMCVETGIGSGSVYTLGKHAFSTRQECEARIAQVQEQLEQEEREWQLRRQLDAVQGLLEGKPMLEYQGDD